MAIVTAALLQNLKTIFTGIFKDALKNAPTQWDKVAMKVKSSTASNTYGWLSKFPHMREWVGDRVFKSMKEHGYSIANKKFESTVDVERTDIEDDNHGIYSSLVSAAGEEAQRHIDRGIFGLLGAGFSTLCYDGQNFFDIDHPVNSKVDGSGTDKSVSNIVKSSVTNKPAWFLLATEGVVKPFIFQERTPAEINMITDPKNDTVFIKDKYPVGVRARREFGYGLWQQAVACRDDLTEANFNEARKMMRKFEADGAKKLGINPSLLVVSPDNEAAANELIKAMTKANGATNPNYKAVEVLVSPWL